MHQVILDRLEEYLSGSLESREFTAHLETCQGCRAELHEIRELSGDLKTLGSQAQLDPHPSFYARLSANLETARPRSLLSLLWLDPSLARRVAFASLLSLAVLGSYLFTRETEYSTGPPTPEVIMAQQAPADNPDVMLATLASYEP